MGSPISIVTVDEVPWEESSHGEHYVSRSRRLSQGMALGVNIERIAPGKVSCPFHWHVKEDEFFLVLRGRVMLRRPGDTVEVREGEAISCPHGEEGAHQFYNHTDEPTDILMVGRNQGDELCFYPDSGKWLIRDLKKVGRFTPADYWDGEPDPPRIKG